MSTYIAIAITALISTLVSAIITGIINLYKSKKGSVSVAITAISNGMLSCLRNDIIGYYNTYYKKGYCPIYAKDAVEKAYQAYHNLGGNGTITGLYNKLMELPEEEKK